MASVGELISYINGYKNGKYIIGLNFKGIEQYRGDYNAIAVEIDRDSVFNKELVIDILSKGCMTPTYDKRPNGFNRNTEVYIVKRYDLCGIELTQDILELFINDSLPKQPLDNSPSWVIPLTATISAKIPNKIILDFVTQYIDIKPIELLNGANLFSFAPISDDFQTMLEICERVYVSMGSSGIPYVNKLIPVRDDYNKHEITLDNFKLVNKQFNEISEDNLIKRDSIRHLHIYNGQKNLI